MSTQTTRIADSEYPEFLQALAVFSKPLGHTASLEFARALHLRLPDGGAWTSKSVSKVIDDCLHQGFLEHVPRAPTE